MRDLSGVGANEWRAVRELPFVNSLQYLPHTDSTMLRAREVRMHPGDGLHLIAAGCQSAGRGQRGNTFFSAAPGGLWCTIVVGIDDLDRHFHVNRAVSLSLIETVGRLAGSAALSVKWPNDIYWADRKLCGVLLETLPLAGPCLAVGLGLNVNLTARDFPPELRSIVTSMLIETGRTYDIPHLLAATLQSFESLRKSPEASLHERYVGRLYGRGRRVSIGGGEGVFEAVRADGRAVVRTARGAEYFSSGPLVFLGEPA